MKIEPFELSISTAVGVFTARYSEKGLTRLNFPAAEPACGTDRTPQRGDPAIPAKIHRSHRVTAAALKKILAGGSPGKLPPLDPAGTEFQRRVWNALRKIPVGKTKSYGEIARAIGRPRAVRAVGGACGANPIPVLVPCHRVLAANGRIGGFSSGLDWKRELLAREGIKI